MDRVISRFHAYCRHMSCFFHDISCSSSHGNTKDGFAQVLPKDKREVGGKPLGVQLLLGVVDRRKK